MMNRSKLLAIAAALTLALLAGCGGDPAPNEAMKERYETGCKLVDQKFAELEAAMRKEMGKDASKSWANEMQRLPDMCTDGKLDQKKVGEWVTPFNDPAQYEDEYWGDEEDPYETSGTIHNIGDPVDFVDDITITVKDDIQKFTPEFDEATETPVKFTIVIKNTGDDVFNPGEIDVNVVSGDMESEPMFDDGISEYPEVDLQPGDTREFVVGFDVADPNGMVISVSPDMTAYEAWAN